MTHRLVPAVGVSLALLLLACPPPGDEAVSASPDAPAGAATAATPSGDEDRTLYAMGAIIARSVTPLGLSEEELAELVAGLEDTVRGSAGDFDANAYRSQIQTFTNERRASAAAVEKEAGQAFALEAAAAEGAEQLDSGLVYVEIEAGDGASPTAGDVVKVHYHGTLRDGTVFDSSVDRGEPATFPLGRVIPCWTEGVQKMKVGGKARLVCPSDIAYGDRGSPPTIAPGATLAFDVELLEIVAPPTASAPEPPPGS